MDKITAIGAIFYFVSVPTDIANSTIYDPPVQFKKFKDKAIFILLFMR